MVIDVVLARDLVVRVFEDVAHGVAQGGPATMADMQGTGGIGRDELVVDLEAVADVALAPVGAGLADGAEDLVVCGGAQVEVDEAGTGNLDPGDGGVGGHVVDDRLCDLGRGHPRETGGTHGDGRGPVAV